MRLTATLVLLALLVPYTAAAQSPRRLALLIGINDYTASRLPRQQSTTPERDWPNLDGAVNDATTLQEMLTISYGFAPAGVTALFDQAATRAAILQSLERLAKGAAKGDVVFFYFAGHGSQVPNSKSDEPDKLDESIVPADSRRGAPDIRDKELRPLFNRILDRGARLTILLDSCHSGSGARGLASGARPRSVKRDPRDVADGTNYGPRPEDRGALVLSAAQDFDSAWEVPDDERQFHGVFSWAWIRSMRDAGAGETAEETFLRAQARMRVERPDQDPVIAGNASVQRTPFLGARIDRRGERTVVAVVKVRRDGLVELNGGWANGLSVGTELVERTSNARLRIAAMEGLGRSRARMSSGQPPPAAIRSGALLEVAGCAAPPGRPLRVWAPRVTSDAKGIAAVAGKFAEAARRRGLRWVADPTEVTPANLVRWNGLPSPAEAAGAPQGPRGWELVAGNAVEHLGGESAVVAAIGRLPKGSSLFVQLPVPAALADIGDRDGIAWARRPEEADYILAGRYDKRHIEYAWVRPAAVRDDRSRSGLPVRSDWSSEDVRGAVMRLRRIHAWHSLESPPAARSPYRLAVRQRRNGVLAKERLFGKETYDLLLQARSPLPPRLSPRFMYVFVIDSFGSSILLFPTSGSVENRFPLADPPPPEIPLGPGSAITIEPPFGVDTFFLLTTDEPLTSSLILEWDGIRTRGVQPRTELERLLTLTATGARAPSIVTPANWSIERVVFESVVR